MFWCRANGLSVSHDGTTVGSNHFNIEGQHRGNRGRRTTLEYQIVARLIVPGDMLVTWGAMLAQRPDLP